MGSISDKNMSVPRGKFSNYFMKIIVFSQFYRSKSATVEIACDLKIGLLANNKVQKQFVCAFEYILI